MAKFKIGDRIKCKSDGDVGVITRFEGGTLWWVMWENAGAELFIDEANMKKRKSPEKEEKKARQKIIAKLLPYVSLDDVNLDAVQLVNMIAGRTEDDFVP